MRCIVIVVCSIWDSAQRAADWKASTAATADSCRPGILATADAYAYAAAVGAAIRASTLALVSSRLSGLGVVVVSHGTRFTTRDPAAVLVLALARRRSLLAWGGRRSPHAREILQHRRGSF